ncbi:MAG: FG-GAP-like repeat-containing protein [Planctomycetaceae bacterium]
MIGAGVAIWVVSEFHAVNVDVEGLFRQARAVANGSRPENAIPLLDKVLALKPDYVNALLYRGQIAAEQGHPDAAIGYFERITADAAPRREAGTARYLEASAWYTKRHAAMAEQQFLAAIDLHPTFLRARESVVQLYYIQSRPIELQIQLNAIREFRDWNLDELFAAQAAWFTSSQPTEHIPILEGFVAADPGDVASHVALARHYLIQNRASDAVGLISRIRSLHPNNLEVHGLLAECHLKLSGADVAWQQFNGDRPKAENPAQWWRALGHCASDTEQWPEAVSALSFAVAGNPYDFESLYKLGISAQRMGETKIAEQHLDRARATEKLSAAVSRLLKTSRDRRELLLASILDIGRHLQQLGRQRESVPWLSTFLGMQPNHPDALALLNPENQPTTDSFPLEPGDPDPDIVAKIGKGIALSRPADTRMTQPTDQVPIQLRDVRDRVGLDFQYFNGNADANHMLLQTVGGGVAVMDYDGDDWPDLFFPNGNEIEESSGVSSEYSDQLFRNIRGVRVDRVTALSGLTSPEFGQGCVSADYNNDGFQDLFVGTFGRLLVYQNQGDGTFCEVAEHAGITGSRWTSSLAMSDLDRDGDLDLYVVNYVKEPFLACRDDDGNPVVCSPANFDAEQDLLFINGGDGRFRDMTQNSGIQASNGKGLGVMIADLDDDGWQDIYVANDGEQNFLFRNQTATSEGDLSFADVGLVSGTAVSRDGRAQAGMGIACDDFDRDGHLDLYVTNFFQDYNTLYLNRGGMLFSDDTHACRLVDSTMSTLGFGAQSVDLDLDGFGEIVVANGHIHDRRIDGTPWQMPPQCFRRTADGTYGDISEQLGPYFHGEYIGRAVARLDFNGDLRPDVVIVNQDQPTALLLNETPQTGRALVLKLRGLQSNRDAIGVRIEFGNGPMRRVIEVTGGDGYCASSERTMFIGTGDATVVPEVTVVWPSGRFDRLTDVPTDTEIYVLESRTANNIPGIKRK